MWNHTIFFRYLPHHNERRSSAKHLGGLGLNVIIDIYFFKINCEIAIPLKLQVFRITFTLFTIALLRFHTYYIFSWFLLTWNISMSAPFKYEQMRKYIHVNSKSTFPFRVVNFLVIIMCCCNCNSFCAQHKYLLYNYTNFHVLLNNPCN